MNSSSEFEMAAAAAAAAAATQGRTFFDSFGDGSGVSKIEHNTVSSISIL